VQDDPLIGTHLGHFKVERVIAVGGMGVIYQATHSVIGRTAAIKVLSEKYSSDRNMIKRLHREARAVNQIGHPNIVDIFDFGQTPDHREYFVMEFLPGRSLAQLLEQHGHLPWRLIAPITTQVLDALAAAHDQGIVHRDMKPENILVIQQDNGDITAKILDFGIAKSVGLGPEGERLTRAGVVLGTPEYIAPEQIRGKEVDGRADLYGVGVMLYEMVMGKRPFDAEQVVSLLMLHLKEPVPRMEAIPGASGVPNYVPAVVTRALAKNPDQRFPDARTFARALELDTSAVAPADGTRPLPELMWEKPEVGGPAAPMGYQPTEAGVGPPLEDPSKVPTAPMGVQGGARTLPGAGPQPQVASPYSPTAPGPTIPTGSMEGTPRRSPLVYIIPAALVLAVGAGVGAWLALKPAPGPTTQPVAKARKDAAPPRKALDIQELFEKVRRTLRAGARNKLPEVRTSCIRGIGILREDLPLLSKLLVEEPEEDVRRAVAMAIAEAGHAAGVAALREARSQSSDLMKVWIDEALLRMGKAEGRIGLKAALKSKKKKVRFTAAAALANARDACAIPVLTEMAKEPVMAKPAAFATISGTLAQLGHQQSYNALETALKEKHPLLKLNAAKALARLGSDHALKTLKSMLREGKHKLAAAEALASLGDYSGLETLSNGVNADDLPTRKTAALGLGYVTDRAALRPLAKALDDTEWPVKASSAESLARILSQMPSALVRRSQDWIRLTFLHNRDWSVRFAAVEITDDMDPELAVRLLGYAYADADPRVRRAAIASLGKLRTKKSIELLRRSLTTDEDEQVRAEAARSLARVGADQEAKKALRGAAVNDTPAVGIPAAGALLALGDARYLPELKKATKGRDPRIRRAAVRALGRWKSPKAVPILRKALEDKSPSVRLAAALALADRGDPSGAKELQAAVKRGGGDEERAESALAKLGIKPARDIGQLAKSKNEEERRRAMVLAPLAPPGTALGVLRRGAVDSSPRVRLAAATALSKMAGKERETAPLLKRLARDPDPLVRARASLGLAKAAKAYSTLSKEDREEVKPVKEAPMREGKFHLREKPKKEGKTEAPDWVPVKELPRDKRYKMAMGFATAALEQGRYGVALRHLRAARRAIDTAAVRCEQGFVFFKIALREHNKKLKQRALKNLTNAEKHYKDCARRARGKLKRKAAKGKRDVQRLRQLIR
jgi:serine/threonine-protein kinase